MKFFDKKIKVALATFAVIIIILLEFGILDGYRFTNVTESGLTITIKNLNKDLGYNFITMSFIVLALMLGYAGVLGYQKSWTGIVALLFTAAFPFIGLFTSYNIFYGWGTAHILPALTALKLHTASQGVQLLIFALIFALYLAIWLVFRYARKKYDDNNPW